MTTHRQPQRTRRPNLEERVAALQTGEEYRVAALWAGGLKAVLVLLLVALALLVGWAGYVVTAQAVSLTNLVRPLSHQQRVWVEGPHREISLANSLPARPDGWGVRLAPALYECGNRPQCVTYQLAFARYIANVSPEVQTARRIGEWVVGGLVLIPPFWVVASSEAALWPAWERRFFRQQTRRRRKAARDGSRE